ncbi:MAG: hypothetical protein A3E82_06515 [Gammaproteobacteria bacterium RIFCSPHIGHO2_12_FULL_38_11]|nr:MAG: hypothetical protein A3E82_06515 [Gammaproteobacteria bacterium RIFCSPHIGHO2_12_FULL_38_11]
MRQWVTKVGKRVAGSVILVLPENELIINSTQEAYDFLSEQNFIPLDQSNNPAVLFDKEKRIVSFQPQNPESSVATARLSMLSTACAISKVANTLTELNDKLTITDPTMHQMVDTLAKADPRIEKALASLNTINITKPMQEMSATLFKIATQTTFSSDEINSAKKNIQVIKKEIQIAKKELTSWKTKLALFFICGFNSEHPAKKIHKMALETVAFSEQTLTFAENAFAAVSNPANALTGQNKPLIKDKPADETIQSTSDTQRWREAPAPAQSTLKPEKTAPKTILDYLRENPKSSFDEMKNWWIKAGRPISNEQNKHTYLPQLSAEINNNVLRELINEKRWEPIIMLFNSPCELITMQSLVQGVSFTTKQFYNVLSSAVNSNAPDNVIDTLIQKAKNYSDLPGWNFYSLIFDAFRDNASDSTIKKLLNLAENPISISPANLQDIISTAIKYNRLPLILEQAEALMNGKLTGKVMGPAEGVFHSSTRSDCRNSINSALYFAAKEGMLNTVNAICNLEYNREKDISDRSLAPDVTTVGFALSIAVEKKQWPVVERLLAIEGDNKPNVDTLEKIIKSLEKEEIKDMPSELKTKIAECVAARKEEQAEKFETPANKAHQQPLSSIVQALKKPKPDEPENNASQNEHKPPTP